MDWKHELIAVPVSDIDRAKDFYVKIGFNADHDYTVSDEIRFVQLTPPGSACSIVLDLNFTEMAPGSVKGPVGGPGSGAGLGIRSVCVGGRRM